MLYPTVQQLTAAKKVNRYSLVIATAKGARFITDKTNREREEAEAKRDSDRFAKDAKIETTYDLETQKPVSIAVEKIVDDEFKIVMPPKPTDQ
jgi:DNA-directed RNA polymerase omega subunit